MPLIAGGDVPILCMSTPATEYPAIIPPDVICCGPILQASSPVREIDPELYSWLTGRPTVLIVLGSVVDLDDEALTIVWTACRVLLDRRKDLQILWKLQRLDSVIDKLTGLDEAGDRMRIVTWLKADPVALLRTGNVICFVSHGGSNSYHEALS